MANISRRIVGSGVVALLGVLLAGCTSPLTDQEQTMTPEESKNSLAELMSSTRELMALPEDGWDPEYPLAADPCTLSNRSMGINYIDVRTWAGSPDPAPEELISTVRDHWESAGLAVTIADQTKGDDTLIRVIGRGDAVRNIRIVIIPGQVTLDGESVCVVGEL